jgi:hypothetical protein
MVVSKHMVLFLAFTLAALSVQRVDNDSRQPIPVSTVYEKPSQYENRVITLVGRMLSTSEVNALEGEGCRSQSKRVDGRPWACAVWVNFPSCGSSGAACDKATQEVLRAYRDAKHDRKQKSLRVTLTGQLRLAPFIDANDGTKVRRGLGHVGAFLAEIVVIDAKINSE